MAKFTVDPAYRSETLAVRAGQERSQFGEHSEATTSVQEDLIGGFVVRTEDKIYNASIKQLLKQFHNHLR